MGNKKKKKMYTKQPHDMSNCTQYYLQASRNGVTYKLILWCLHINPHIIFLTYKCTFLHMCKFHTQIHTHTPVLMLRDHFCVLTPINWL